MRSVLNRVLKPYKDTPHGRSAGTRTPGLLLPKQARYQLRNTPLSNDRPRRKKFPPLSCFHGHFDIIIYFKRDCKYSFAYGKIFLFEEKEEIKQCE